MTSSNLISLLENGLLSRITCFLYNKDKPNIYSLNHNITSYYKKDRKIMLIHRKILYDITCQDACFGCLSINESGKPIYCSLFPKPYSAFCSLCAYILFINDKNES
jgi:hypothetical protein